MSRMKTLLKYVLWIVLFFVFSEVMININLETTYSNIGRKDNLSQVSVHQAQATKVNGRIKGKINSEEELSSKYLRIDLFSERNNFLGSKYVEMSTLPQDKSFEVFFKVQDVEFYEVKFVDEKVEGELPEMLKDLTKEEVLIGVFLTRVIFF